QYLSRQWVLIGAWLDGYDKLDELGVKYQNSHIEDIVDCYDIPYEMDKFFTNRYRDEDREYEGPAGLEIDQIDDLFERC
ncbi:MAG: hypothetical protein OJI67_05085, partial [Prosthecobacter sp.]|nr:hypothetical protein [Prosthecobacter sp.]